MYIHEGWDVFQSNMSILSCESVSGVRVPSVCRALPHAGNFTAQVTLFLRTISGQFSSQDVSYD